MEENKSVLVKEIYVLEDDPDFKEILCNLKEKEIEEYIKDKLSDFEEDFEALCNEFKVRFETKEWIILSDGLCYIPEINAIIPNFKTKKCYFQHSSNEFFKSLKDMPCFDEYFGEFFERFKEQQDRLEDFIVNNKEKAKVIYSNSKEINNKIIGFNFKEFDGFTYLNNDNEFMYYTSDGIIHYGEKNNDLIFTFPIKYLKNNDPHFIIKYWLEHKIRPIDLIDKQKNTYDLLRYLFKKNPLKLDDLFLCDSLSFDSNKKDIIAKWFYDQYNDAKKRQQFYYLPSIKSIYENATLLADNEFFEKFKRKILDSDKIRTSIDNNDDSILTDLDSGHWDLWDYNELLEKKCKTQGKNYIKVNLNDENLKYNKEKIKYLYKRAPSYDYNKYRNDVVAIDFGTKSTVVSIMCAEEQTDAKDNEEEQIIPIKVSKNENQTLDPYENPSVIEFNDSDSFIKDYNERSGRPNTKWEDLIVSHEAFNDIEKTDRFYSIIPELKSWCSKTGNVADKSYTIREPGKIESYTFKPYLDLTENDKDPVELYAYYLGLFINKPSEKKIFSRYRMSFPVTFTNEVKQKIIQSFKKGITKSLPTALVDNPKFKLIIDEYLSEPAAYAITALKKYGFEDELVDNPDEDIHYAVFDFGGGTTDFNFGIYSLKPDEKDEDHPFVLTHLGKKGLEHIGGEKLIKYLAFEYFKSKESKEFKSNGYKIYYTAYDDCPRQNTKDCEFFKPDNMHAKLNMHKAMEGIRWIFEDPNNTKNNANVKNILEQEGKITLNLFDEVKGESEIDFCIKDFPFQKKLASKIESAIKEFLVSLKSHFKKVKNIKKLHIFLAGNSSKSVLFNLLLSKYFGKDYENNGIKALSVEDFNDIWKNDIEEICNTVDDSFVKGVKEELGNKDLEFFIYPPLRTKDAKKIIDEKRKKKNIKAEYDINNIFEPSGKTGVAYGMLVSENVREVKDNSSSFEYYIGKKDKSGVFFKVVLPQGAPLGVWSDIHIAQIKENKYSYEYRYTTSDRAKEGRMKIAPTGKGFIDIDDNEPLKDGDLMYIRPVSKNEIEWQIVSDKKYLRTKDNIIKKFCKIVN